MDLHQQLYASKANPPTAATSNDANIMPLPPCEARKLADEAPVLVAEDALPLDEVVLAPVAAVADLAAVDVRV